MYREIQARHPELVDNQDVIRAILSYRYGSQRDQAKYLDVIRHLQRCGAVGLATLVEAILGVEAGYWENDSDVQVEFSRIIEEELRVYNVPELVVRGAPWAASGDGEAPTLAGDSGDSVPSGRSFVVLCQDLANSQGFPLDDEVNRALNRANSAIVMAWGGNWLDPELHRFVVRAMLHWAYFDVGLRRAMDGHLTDGLRFLGASELLVPWPTSKYAIGIARWRLGDDDAAIEMLEACSEAIPIRIEKLRECFDLPGLEILARGFDQELKMLGFSSYDSMDLAANEGLIELLGEG